MELNLVNNTLQEGLNIPKKKFQDKYFQVDGDEIGIDDIDFNKYWYRKIYDNNGNVIYWEDSEGNWDKFKYNLDGNQTYFENSLGVWWKKEYDDGDLIYYENSDGEIVDYRPINEGLNIPKASYKTKYYQNNKEIDFNDINPDEFWEKKEYDKYGMLIYLENSKGYWFRRKYDSDGNKIFWENSRGEWVKETYDQNGQQIYYEDNDGLWYKNMYDENGYSIYYEDSNGFIRDDRPNINEGLCIPKAKQPTIFDYLDVLIKKVENTPRPGYGSNLFYLNSSDGSLVFKVLMYTSGRVNILQHRTKTTEHILETYNLTFKDFEQILGSWITEKHKNLINEGLNIPKKKYHDKYFQYNKEVSVDDINKNDLWYKEEYNKYGNIVYLSGSDGAWGRKEYDDKNNLVYHETSNGEWVKYEYNDNGDVVYSESSNGKIVDNRPINEGLNIPKKKYQDKYFQFNIEYNNFEDINPNYHWYKESFDNNGNMIHKKDSDGSWEKYEYDENNNVICFERPGYWTIWEYDQNGNEIYVENSRGHIIDNRPINEGLNIPKRITIDRFPDELVDYTISNGTLNTEDLITTFLDLFHRYKWNYDVQKLIDDLSEEWDLINKTEVYDGVYHDNVMRIYEELEYLMIRLSPNNTNFGSHEGNSSLYGFWSTKDSDITPEEALELLRDGVEVMVKPYDDDYTNYTGITIDDFEGETDDEILNYLREKTSIQVWE